MIILTHKFNLIEQKKGGQLMAFNYSKLVGRIIEKYGSQYNFAVSLGISERSLSLKLNNKVPWKQTEIEKSLYLLDIPKEELHLYFFDLKVQFN